MSKIFVFFTAFAIIILLSFGTISALVGLDDFDIDKHEQFEIVFQTEAATLSGTLLLPSRNKSAPIVILVHGDGPQDRFSNSGYLPIINALLDRGIGVYSWDKAGINKSTGNWLHQSMADRADEALAAYKAVSIATKSYSNKIGFLGFSQAGWVLPKLSDKVPSDTYIIMVGTARNWRSQGIYYSTKKLEAEGRTKQYIKDNIAANTKINDALFSPPVSYKQYLQRKDTTAPLSKARFRFIALNYGADASVELKNMRQPVLFALGEKDLNVDSKKEAEFFRNTTMGNNKKNRVILIPNATHGLLKAEWFNYQLSGEWPLYKQMLFVIMGRRAYAEDAIQSISSWVVDVSS